jgi:cob(I)alamin adenosyltransferase
VKLAWECILNKGLIIVFTGDGKGKTSAALGIALRASGHKMSVSVIQFIKSSDPTGEAMAAERLAPELEFVSLGSGFVNCLGDEKPLSEHKRSAAEAMALARQRILSGSRDIVVLDEINTAVALGLLDVKEVIDLLAQKPSSLHVVLTGRSARPEVIEAADLVTEMRNIKHPYDRGIPAQKGIDY